MQLLLLKFLFARVAWKRGHMFYFASDFGVKFRRNLTGSSWVFNIRRWALGRLERVFNVRAFAPKIWFDILMCVIGASALVNVRHCVFNLENDASSHILYLFLLFFVFRLKYYWIPFVTPFLASFNSWLPLFLLRFCSVRSASGGHCGDAISGIF